MPPTQPPADLPRWVLRPRDQAAVAALALVTLLAMALAWWRAGGSTGLIEIEDAPRREVEFFVDVNTAPWPEIAQLPTVGETLARRIVEDRKLNGPYGSVEDLERVYGLGPKTLERIRPFVRIEVGARDEG